jgi:hypothetical protein
MLPLPEALQSDSCLLFYAVTEIVGAIPVEKRDLKRTTLTLIFVSLSDRDGRSDLGLEKRQLKLITVTLVFLFLRDRDRWSDLRLVHFS